MLDAHTAGQSVKVYHYANPEPNHLRRIAEARADHDIPTLDAVNALIDDTFIDMFPIVRANFFGRDGLGLKVAATHGAGSLGGTRILEDCSPSRGLSRFE